MLKRSSGTEIEIQLEIIISDSSIYTMNHPKLIASYQVVEEWEKALKRSRRSSAQNMKPAQVLYLHISRDCNSKIKQSSALCFYDGNSRRLDRKWFYKEAYDPWFTRHSFIPYATAASYMPVLLGTYNICFG